MTRSVQSPMVLRLSNNVGTFRDLQVQPEADPTRVRMESHLIRRPEGQPIEAVRAIREEIQDRVKELIRMQCSDCYNAQAVC
jgi:lipopolysaccharide biosynthesis regulator YciM